MTLAQRHVLKKYPKAIVRSEDAYANGDPNKRQFYIVTPLPRERGKNTGQIIGQGQTKHEAWKAAAYRIDTDAANARWRQETSTPAPSTTRASYVDSADGKVK